MSEQLRYITDENGEQIGVVLNLQQYQELKSQELSHSDAELLIGLSEEELYALAESMLVPIAQERLEQLLEANAENQLSDEESTELDRLLTQVDHLTILKTRARYTLKKHNALLLAA
ncbi:MAG: hypothetical protein AAF702_08605 [Chloroflexota bacterium]